MSVASGRSEGVMIVQFTPAVDRRLNCNFQTPTSTGTSTSRTCAASSPDWINMYCAFGSSWARAADDINAEQTVTAAKKIGRASCRERVEQKEAGSTWRSKRGTGLDKESE